jgi:hypothetical protein
MPLAPDSRSSPTLDCHTDAIIRREGADAVCSTHLRESSSLTSVSMALATPTNPERSPFTVRKSTFPVGARILVRPSAAAERARAREAVAIAAVAARRSAAPAPAPIHARSLPTWSVCAAFALGATVAVSASVMHERGVVTAVVACVVAGIVTMFSGLSATPTDAGKARAVRPPH